MKNNRAYKKGKPFKDCSLVLVVCEGEKTEPAYFSFFEKINPRKCKVEIIRNEDDETVHKSAPKWLLEKVKKYSVSNQIGEGDVLFIVCDIDAWKVKSLYEVNDYCIGFNNYFLIISNPCFEVWLNYHLDNPQTKQIDTCKEWKQIVHQKTITGFAIEKFIVKIFDAVNNAKSDDKDPEYFLAATNHSKVYKIIETIVSKIGLGNFKTFIADIDK